MKELTFSQENTSHNRGPSPPSKQSNSWNLNRVPPSLSRSENNNISKSQTFVKIDKINYTLHRDRTPKLQVDWLNFERSASVHSMPVGGEREWHGREVKPRYKLTPHYAKTHYTKIWGSPDTSLRSVYEFGAVRSWKLRQFLWIFKNL